MRRSDLQTELADQLYTWPDNYALPAAQTAFCCFAPTPPPAIAPDAPARLPAPRFSHRALQTLWQTRLQMRSRPRSRPKVLPLSQSLRATSANGLHPPGPSPPDHRISGQLSSTPSDFGRNLCHQSRAVISPRGTLRNRHESSLNGASLRCQTWQSAPRQHALCLARQASRHPGGRA